MTSWSLSIKIWILQAYRMHYSKNMSWCETECKVFILGGQKIVQKERRDGGEGVERGLRKGAERG